MLRWDFHGENGQFFECRFGLVVYACVAYEDVETVW